jgi:hypothetical protein
VFNTIQVAGAPAPPAAAPPAAETPAATAPEATMAEASAPPGRREGERRDETAADLVEKGKREFMAGNPQGALQSCQAALQMDPQNPIARECVVKAKAAISGAGPRRR